MAMITGGQAVAETLASWSYESLRIVSVHNLPIYDALSLHPTLRRQCRHEQAAAHAADAYLSPEAWA